MSTTPRDAARAPVVPVPPSVPAALPGSASVQKKAADFAAERDWPGYFSAVVGKPARETLVKALDLFDREPRSGRFAVDLGCGEGRDTLELLRRGWRVLATDASAAAFEHLRPRVAGEARERLQMLALPFEQIHIPAADLVNASYCLPFCEAGQFRDVWGRIEAAVRPGGRFAGQFFGDRDEWVRSGHTVHLTRGEVEACLRGFEAEYFVEEEKDDSMATGGMKHWHVFHVVARKK